MKIQLQEGEDVLKEGGANHFQGLESVGGRLFLTNQRIYFSSHSINVQGHTLSIPFSEIKFINKRNTIFVIPNGIIIELQDGTNEKFVVFGRKEWIKEIGERIK